MFQVNRQSEARILLDIYYRILCLWHWLKDTSRY